MDEVKQIVKLCPRKRQTLLFSATMTEQVNRLSAVSLQSPVRLAADQANRAPSDLTQEVSADLLALHPCAPPSHALERPPRLHAFVGLEMADVPQRTEARLQSGCDVYSRALPSSGTRCRIMCALGPLTRRSVSGALLADPPSQGIPGGQETSHASGAVQQIADESELPGFGPCRLPSGFAQKTTVPVSIVRLFSCHTSIWSCHGHADFPSHACC